MAGEERPGEQRQGRHPRDFIRWVLTVDGARQPAPGAQGVRADESDGRRLDGRRLVPQRRVSTTEYALHLRTGGDARERSQMVDEPLRRLRYVHAGGIGGRVGTAARPGTDRLLAEVARTSELRRLLAGSGSGQDFGGATVASPGDACAQP